MKNTYKIMLFTLIHTTTTMQSRYLQPTVIRQFQQTASRLASTYYQENHHQDGTVLYSVKKYKHPTTIDLPDGSTTTYYPDGIEITRKPNGDKITEYPDGSKIIHLGNGTQITCDLHSTTIITHPNGTKITHYNDGSTEYEPPQED